MEISRCAFAASAQMALNDAAIPERKERICVLDPPTIDGGDAIPGAPGAPGAPAAPGKPGVS